MTDLLYFDIETIADQNRSAMWQSKQEEIEKAGKEFFPALHPEFCKIVSLGWAFNEDPPDSLVIGVEKAHKDGSGQQTRVTEEHILGKFWNLVSQDPMPVLVGFNILKFDLPVIFVRSALLSVKSKRQIDRRPWGNDCIDLFETRQFTAGGGKLKELARYFNFDIPAEDIDGSQVEHLFQTDPARIAEYVESDIVVTRQLYHFYKGYFVRDLSGSTRQIREINDVYHASESTS